jgi:hypothetical protein
MKGEVSRGVQKNKYRRFRVFGKQGAARPINHVITKGFGFFDLGPMFLRGLQAKNTPKWRSKILKKGINYIFLPKNRAILTLFL